MTWRPTKYLLEGELDNTKPGKVTGWLRFAGLKGTVAVSLEGDFDRDTRGGKVVLAGRYEGAALEAEDEMEGFASRQTGVVGNITAGLAPQSYTPYHDFLEAIGDPEHEEHEAMLEWVGGDFDPETFDLAALNKRLPDDIKLMASWR